MFPHDIFDLVRREKLYAHAARRPSMVPNDILSLPQRRKKKSRNRVHRTRTRCVRLILGASGESCFRGNGRSACWHTFARHLCLLSVLCCAVVCQPLIACAYAGQVDQAKSSGKIHAKTGFDLHTSAHTPHIAGLEVGKNSSLGSF